MLVLIPIITAKINYSICTSQSNKLIKFSLLQFILLNEATLVLINDGESLLDIIGRLASQTDLGEEGLVVEGAISCAKQYNKERREKNMVSLLSIGGQEQSYCSLNLYIITGKNTTA